jgi:hypothetical protein
MFMIFLDVAKFTNLTPLSLLISCKVRLDITAINFFQNVIDYPYLKVKSIYETVGDHQCGFRRNRSTTDQIFCIRQIKKTPWSESASELYRPSDRRLSAK